MDLEPVALTGVSCLDCLVSLGDSSLLSVAAGKKFTSQRRVHRRKPCHPEHFSTLTRTVGLPVISFPVSGMYLELRSFIHFEEL